MDGARPDLSHPHPEQVVDLKNLECRPNGLPTFETGALVETKQGSSSCVKKSRPAPKRGGNSNQFGW